MKKVGIRYLLLNRNYYIYLQVKIVISLKSTKSTKRHITKATKRKLWGKRCIVKRRYELLKQARALIPDLIQDKGSKVNSIVIMLGLDLTQYRYSTGSNTIQIFSAHFINGEVTRLTRAVEATNSLLQP